MLLRTSVATGALALATLASSTALAQVAAGAPSGPAQAAPPVPSEASAGGIQDIVVTAQRRSESVQKSSLAIEVVGAQELVSRGVTSAQDLTKVAPSITVSQNGAFTQTNIRGAGDLSNTGLGQQAVSYSLDGVVFGSGIGISQNFYDLQRVEVLKGPQGTLYGRNATGGAVNILTNRPTHEFGGYINAQYGNYDDKELEGAINVPLGQTLAVRGSFAIHDRDGYLSDGTDDDRRQAGRIQALWEPTDTVNLRLSADYSHQGGMGAGLTLWPKRPGTGPWTAISDPINNAAMAFYTNGLHSPFDTDSRIDLKEYSVSGELNWKLGDFATLTVLPAYRRIHLDQIAYGVGFRTYYQPLVQNQKSVEVRLGHQSDKLKWTVGGFYYDNRTHYTQIGDVLTPPITFNNFSNTQVISNLNRSLAAFGEATYSLTDSFRIIGGLRYTHDHLAIDGIDADAATPPAPGSPFVQHGRLNFNAVTWKGGAEYDVGPHSLAYFTASKGYKSGGFFVAPGGNDNTFKPERLTAFDVGIRNRFFDNKLQVNIEGFYWRYRNQQFNAVGFLANQSIAYITRNFGSSDPRGVDLDIVYKPTSHDTFSAGASYTRARFKKFDVEYPEALAFALKTGSHCQVSPTATPNASGAPVFNINCAGAPLPRTPEWSGTVSYQHIFDLAQGATLTADIQSTWSSSRYLNADFFTPETKDGGYALLDASLTYTAPGGKWTLTGFGRNLTNHPVYQGAFTDVLNGFGRSDTPNFVERVIAAPRTYGVRVGLKF